MKNNCKKKEEKKQVGRQIKNVIEPISDTAENDAKSLFGIRPDGKKVKTMGS